MPALGSTQTGEAVGGEKLRNGWALWQLKVRSLAVGSRGMQRGQVLATGKATAKHDGYWASARSAVKGLGHKEAKGQEGKIGHRAHKPFPLPRSTDARQKTLKANKGALAIHPRR